MINDKKYHRSNVAMHSRSRVLQRSRNGDPHFTAVNEASSTKVTPQCTVGIWLCKGLVMRKRVSEKKIIDKKYHRSKEQV